MPTFLITGETSQKARIPTAVLTVGPEVGVIGSVVRLDGRQSHDLDNLDLRYEFTFISVPIGSMIAREGFRTLEPGLVTFSPDRVGDYVVALKVSNGTFASEEVRGTSSIRATLVPHARGLVPDGKWIWSYVRDVWQQVEGREIFETLWSVLIQLTGAELLKLYQTDFNKSIRDIQELYQRRWLSYEPRFEVEEDNTSFFLGNTAAGNDAITGTSKLVGSGLIVGGNEFVVLQGPPAPFAIGKSVKVGYSRASANIGEYSVTSLNATKNGFRIDGEFPDVAADQLVAGARLDFSFQSTEWVITSTGTRRYDVLQSELLGYPVYHTEDGGDPVADVLPGDVVVFSAGPNAGYYRILSRDGSTVVVDREPPSANDSSTSAYGATIYRPVGFTIQESAESLTDILCIPLASAPTLANLAPGRLIVLNGQSYTVLRANLDLNQVVPLVIITLDRSSLLSGQTLPWRVPNTLVSTTQNFDELGVSPGDVLLSQVTLKGRSVELPLQIVGTDRNRLGFVLTDEPITPGVVPQVPASFYKAIAKEFEIPGLEERVDGLSFKGVARSLLEAVEQALFKNGYWDKQLDNESQISVSGLPFFLSPTAIVRNRLIPVDTSVMSIPALQEYVRQPTIRERDGKVYQLRNNEEFELPRVPVILTENSEFVLDDENAVVDTFTFRAGTTTLEVENGDFVDRGIVPGDKLFIDLPLPLSKSGGYTIKTVLGNNRLLLDQEIPHWERNAYVTSPIRIVRSRPGKYVRVIPGLFSAKNRAPDRLWAEVTFFDNSETIENNFGALVALSKGDLAKATNGVSYRQAVAGLMYAYTRGSAIDTVRLGASILLGLPFTEHRGIIRSIESDYRLDASGDAVQGRLLIEDVDDAGVALGTLRVYTYPVDDASELAGIDDNPKTGKPWEIGDIVEPFSSLAKGVQVLDYQNADFSGTTDVFKLQQFHSIRVRVNDNIFHPKEIALVSDFLKKITPSYIALYIAKTVETGDAVAIDEALKMKLRTPLGAAPSIVDNVATGLPFALIHDAKTLGGIFPIRLDSGFHIILRGGKDLITETVDGTRHIRVAAGGFLNPRALESFEGPLIVPGDKLLIRSGHNIGLYEIETVSDTELTLVDDPVLYNGEQQYAVLRLVTPMFASGANATTTAGSRVISLPGGQLRTRFVMPGDLLFVDVNGTPTKHEITRVLSSTEGVWDQVEVRVAASTSVAGVAWRIYRPWLMTELGEIFPVSFNSGNTLSTTNPVLKKLADIGDELVIQREDKVRLTILDPERLYVTPAPPLGSYSVKLVKNGFSGSTPVFDVLRNSPLDVPTVALRRNTSKAPDAYTTNGSPVVSFGTLPNPAHSGVLPGDMLVLLDGGNASVDVGYGPGVFPIAQVSSSNVRLTLPLTSTGAAHWKVRRTLYHTSNKHHELLNVSFPLEYPASASDVSSADASAESIMTTAPQFRAIGWQSGVGYFGVNDVFTTGRNVSAGGMPELIGCTVPFYGLRYDANTASIGAGDPRIVSLYGTLRANPGLGVKDPTDWAIVTRNEFEDYWTGTRKATGNVEWDVLGGWTKGGVGNIGGFADNDNFYWIITSEVTTAATNLKVTPTLMASPMLRRVADSTITRQVRNGSYYNAGLGWYVKLSGGDLASVPYDDTVVVTAYCSYGTASNASQDFGRVLVRKTSAELLALGNNRAASIVTDLCTPQEIVLLFPYNGSTWREPGTINITKGSDKFILDPFPATATVSNGSGWVRATTNQVLNGFTKPATIELAAYGGAFQAASISGTPADGATSYNIAQPFGLSAGQYYELKMTFLKPTWTTVNHRIIHEFVW